MRDKIDKYKTLQLYNYTQQKNILFLIWLQAYKSKTLQIQLQI